MTRITISLAALAAFLLTPAFANADDQKVRVSFGAGVTAGAISGEAALGGSVGYQFSPHFSFDVEVAGANAPADRFGDRVFALGNSGNSANNMGTAIGRIGDLMGGIRGGMFGFQPNQIPSFAQGDLRIDNGGNTLLSTAGFRYLVPTKSERFHPYLSGGLGVSRTEENLSISNGSRTTTAGRPGAPAIPGGRIDLSESSSHVGLVLSGGVGASLRIVKQLSLDIDAKYYRMDRGRDLGTFGGGVSYRF